MRVRCTFCWEQYDDAMDATERIASLESALKERDAKIAELSNACRHALTIVEEYESSIDENGRGYAGTIVLKRLLEAALVAEREKGK